MLCKEVGTAFVKLIELLRIVRGFGTAHRAFGSSKKLEVRSKEGSSDLDLGANTEVADPRCI